MCICQFVIFITLFSIGVTTDLANLQPNGNVTKYVNDDFVFTCILSQPSIEIDWIINETRYEEGSVHYYTFIERDIFLLNHTISKISAQNISKNLNQTEIYCVGWTQNNMHYKSKTATILLQGKLEEVRSPTIVVRDTVITLTWEPPFTLIDQNLTTYEIVIFNYTSMAFLEPEILNDTTIYYIESKSSRLITCDNYGITITPYNKLGPGKNYTISLPDLAPQVLNYDWISTENEKNLDLILIMNSPICSVSNMLLKNMNTIRPDDEEDKFKDFSLIQNDIDTFSYKFSIELTRGYKYKLLMTVTNYKTTNAISYIISTHRLRNVTINLEANHQIKIQICHFFSNEISNGTLVILLPCESKSCNTIIYRNSIFLPTNNLTSKVNLPDANRCYKILGYDTKNDGEIISSVYDNSTSFSIPSQIICFNHSNASQTDVPSLKHDCNFMYNNKTLASVCTPTNTEESKGNKQQMILLLKNEAEELIITEPQNLNETLCYAINSSDIDRYYITVLLLSNSSKDHPNDVIGRNNIMQVDEDLCPTNKERYTDKILIGIFCGVVPALSIIFIIAGITYKKKCSKPNQRFQIRHPANSEDEEKKEN